MFAEKKWKFIAVAISTLFLLDISHSNGEIVFEDGFETYNWESPAGYGTGVTGAAPFNLTPDITQAGWVSYRYSPNANIVGDPVFSVSSENTHTGNSSLKYEMENTFITWNGGGLTMYLGSSDNSTSGYSELYISVWTKFEDGFILPQVGYMMKLFRIYLGINADTEGSGWSSAKDDNNVRKLQTYMDYLGNNYMYLTASQWPSTRIPAGAPFPSVADAKGPRFTDYHDWKRVMFHIKLNTDGNSDGLLEFYVNDSLAASLPNIELVHSSEGLVENNKINVISVPDNYSKIVEGMPPKSEAAFFIDDFVVSTTYVPLNYSPGGIPPVPDTTSPGNVTDLLGGTNSDTTVDLSWTASGDDGNTGTASSYDIRYSATVLNESNWAAATQASGEPSPQTAGTAETMTITSLSPQTTYFVALKIKDDASNSSVLSNIASFTTTADSTPPGDVTNERVVASDGKLTFSWKNPLTSDFAGVEIRYRTDGVSPVNISDGTFVINKPGVPGANETFEHTGLVNGQVYYYSIFTYDTSNNYSQTVHITGMPKIRSTNIPANHLVQWAGDSWILNHSEGGNSSVTANNNAAFVAGFDGEGLEVDSDSSWAQVSATGNINSVQGTVEFYFKPYWNHDDGRFHQMFQAGSGSINEIKLWKATNGYLFLYVWDNSGASRRVLVDSAQYQFTTNQWVKIKIAWHDSPTSGGNNLEIYVDDILKGSSSGEDWSVNRLDFTGKNIYFGGSAENSADEVNGIIDEVIIYSTFPDKVAPNPPSTITVE